MTVPGDVDSLRREIARLEALREQTELQLRTVHTVSRVLGEETTVAAAMPRVLAALGDVLRAKLAAFWVPVGSTLEVRSVWVAEPYEAAIWDQLCRRHRFASGSGLPGRVWRDRRPAWIPDLATDSAMPRHDGLLMLRARSGFGFPIVIGDEVAGVIELFSTRTEPPDDQLVSALCAIGVQVGQFILKERTQDRLHAQLEQRDQMTRASRMFTASLEVDEIVTELAKLTVPWLGDWCTIHILENDGSVRHAATNYGEPSVADRVHALVDRRAPQPELTGGLLVAVRDRTTLFAAQVTDERLVKVASDADDLDALRALALSSYAIVPIVARGVAIGALTVACCNPRRMSTEDIELLEELAARAGLAATSARLYTEAHSAALELVVERETLTKLNEIGPALSAELDPQALAQAVTATATQLTGAQFGAFFTSSNIPGESFLLRAVAGVTREAYAALPKNELFAPVFEGRGVVRMDDLAADPRHGKTPWSRGLAEGALLVRSYLSVPVRTRAGAVIGGLVFGHEKPRMFAERAQRIAIGLAANAATAMDNARLYTDAQRLIRELETTNAELDQFAYVAAHDLRAPLRGISNLALWIEEDLGESAPPKIIDQLRLLKSRAARMDKLINGLLELARVGRIRQQPERVDVTDLLHETIDRLNLPSEARVLIVGAMPTLYAERVALQQVFLNLVANSLQHAVRPDVVIRITATQHAEHAELAVADNGPGIAPEHQGRVWQIFQTLQTKDLIETTGIGLTIVKKQVEAYGGRAWIDNTVREGTTVRFTWPLRAK